jgi:hypothetical protein
MIFAVPGAFFCSVHQVVLLLSGIVAVHPRHRMTYSDLKSCQLCLFWGLLCGIAIGTTRPQVIEHWNNPCSPTSIAFDVVLVFGYTVVAPRGDLYGPRWLLPSLFLLHKV